MCTSQFHCECCGLTLAKTDDVRGSLCDRGSQIIMCQLQRSLWRMSVPPKKCSQIPAPIFTISNLSLQPVHMKQLFLRVHSSHVSTNKVTTCFLKGVERFKKTVFFIWTGCLARIFNMLLSAPGRIRKC